MARFLRVARTDRAAGPSFYRQGARLGVSARASRRAALESRAFGHKKVMDVIVIGGGIASIATAYQLHAAGHRVCVIERHATVAQGATYGQGGPLLPSPLDVWFGRPSWRRAARSKAAWWSRPVSTRPRVISSSDSRRCAIPRRSPRNTRICSRSSICRDACSRTSKAVWNSISSNAAACCTCSASRANSKTRSRPSICSRVAACRIGS